MAAFKDEGGKIRYRNGDEVPLDSYLTRIPDEQKKRVTKRKWLRAKAGAAMMCLSIALYGVGIYLMTALSSKIFFFSRSSGALMVVGSGLVAWNAYDVYFRK